MPCSLFLTGTSTPVVAVCVVQPPEAAWVAWEEKSGLWKKWWDPQTPTGVWEPALLELPGHVLVSRTCRDVGRPCAMEQQESSLRGFLETDNLRVSSAAVDHRAWKRRSHLAPQDMAPCRSEVARGATLGCQSPGGLDLMVSSLGTWKPLVGFCHFFASPSCGNYWNISSWTVVKLAWAVSFNQQ